MTLMWLDCPSLPYLALRAQLMSSVGLIINDVIWSSSLVIDKNSHRALRLFSAFLLAALSTFLPKYIEAQFNLMASWAAFLMGTYSHFPPYPPKVGRLHRWFLSFPSRLDHSAGSRLGDDNRWILNKETEAPVSRHTEVLLRRCYHLIVSYVRLRHKVRQFAICRRHCSLQKHVSLTRLLMSYFAPSPPEASGVGFRNLMTWIGLDFNWLVKFLDFCNGN